jgi:hypothetical protein
VSTLLTLTETRERERARGEALFKVELKICKNTFKVEI